MTTASSDSQQLGPVQSQERVVLLDVLRAIAIFGMLYVHNAGGLSPEAAAENGGGFLGFLSTALYALAEGKFWALFALLMGIGIALQVERADQRGADVTPTFLRRTLSLYILGTLLALVMWVHQLIYLAVSGLVAFFLFYPLRHRRVLFFVVFVWVLASGTIPRMMSAYERPPREPYTAERVEERKLDAVERHQRYLEREVTVRWAFQSPDLIRRNVERTYSQVPRELRSLGLMATNASELLPFVLLGVFLWQMGVLRKSWEHRRFFLYLLIFSGLIGLAAVTGEEVLTTRSTLALSSLADPLTPRLAAAVPLLRDFSQIGLDLAYLSLTALLLPMRWVGGLLKRLAPAGRMAFTNYLLHHLLPPVLFPLLFGWWLPGIGPLVRIVKMGVVFALMVLFSTWWLKRFRFGPFEWLWRSLTYWKLQPMRVERPVPAE